MRRPKGLPRTVGNDAVRATGTMTDECLLYRWARNKGGYGVIRDHGRLIYAHRWYYEQKVGVIRAGRVVNHLCEQKGCINPAHLEVLHHSQNVKYSWPARRRRGRGRR